MYSVVPFHFFLHLEEDGHVQEPRFLPLTNEIQFLDSSIGSKAELIRHLTAQALTWTNRTRIKITQDTLECSEV